MSPRPESRVEPVIADRFELHRQLGRGGMATVWEATDRRLGRKVAIKLLREDASDDLARRIEREARAAARINDPRALTVLDLDHTEDGMPFLVLERLTGETLADRLEHGPVDDDELLRLRDDLVGALASAHAAGVVHRDIKPSNVLVDGERFRVGDFGIASLDDELSGESECVGTPVYLAPERLRGEPATARSDVFSAGAVLYEAATGQHPFCAGPDETPLERLRTGEFDPLHVDGRIGPGLAHAIHRALAVDPHDRPADAQELLELACQDGGGTADQTVVVGPGAADATQAMEVTQAIGAMPAPGPTRDTDRTAVLSPDAHRSTDDRSPSPPAPRRPARAAPSLIDRLDLTGFRRAQLLFVTGAILLLVALLVAASIGQSGDADGGTLQFDQDGPRAQLDATLERIEELGR